MNTRQIDRALRRRCRDFEAVLAADQPPLVLPTKRPLMYVLNTDPQARPGQHWVALYIGHDDVCEYFDSFGQEPTILFERYLNRHCRDWIYNDVRLQSAVSRFCAHYCIMYCMYKSRGKSMYDLLNRFTNDTGLHDVIAHKFACKLF